MNCPHVQRKEAPAVATARVVYKNDISTPPDKVCGACAEYFRANPFTFGGSRIIVEDLPAKEAQPCKAK